MSSAQEQQELHKKIWGIADNLRGSTDGWDFKNYVLITMFYRYISENFCDYVNNIERANGDPTFSYADISDEKAEEIREYLIQVKGFFIFPSELFCNVQAHAAEDENLNLTLPKIFEHIEDSSKDNLSENNLSGLFDDFNINDTKLGYEVSEKNKNLVALLNGIAEMDLGNMNDHTIDTFGDAYEYLIGMYASNAGKSGGEFFTPADVSILLTRLGTVGKTKVEKVYDPACGSGSLLLKARKILGPDGVHKGYYGQEINSTTYNLCRINMWLHDIPFDEFHIELGDTLTNPKHWDDQPFDLIVSNPPYSIHWEGADNALLIDDPRYAPAGVLAPKSHADMAFILHALSWLSEDGTAAIVCFPGILYRSGAEQKIRKYLIDNNFIDCIIQLPDKLFYGTSIATCIMVLKKNKRDNAVLFIDASNEYIKVTKNNKLTEENIDHIVNTFANREDIVHFARLVPYDEIKENEYNLSVSTYVEPEDTTEKIDITLLNQDLRETVARENALRADIDQIIAEIEGDSAIYTNSTI